MVKLKRLRPLNGRAYVKIGSQVVKAVDIGRNEPCPCGSNKKFKNCHGDVKKEGNYAT